MSEFKVITGDGIKALPVLFKKTSTGAIQYWEIRVQHYNPEQSFICTRFGQMDTSNPQETTDVVKSGKNLGKKNETTISQQAELEAKSKWQKQLDSGYVESRERAEAGENDLKGVECMLAHAYGILLNGEFIPDQNHKIKFPALVQPKFDGIRNLTGEGIQLFSREHKPINSVPHIQKAILEVLGNSYIPFDGELYNHEYKHDFEKITSIVSKKNEVAENHEIVQYHIYDVALPDMPFILRNKLIQEVLANAPGCLQMVPTEVVNSHEEVLGAFKKWRDLGYEGIMVRNTNANYEGKRSYNLLKLKEFFEEEFEIIGFKEGKGKLIGHLGSWICKCGDNTFDPPMKCTQARKKELWETKEQYIGKKLTVRFTGYTKAKNVPRFPEGIRFREEGF